MRPLIALCALYAAFTLGRWYAPRYDARPIVASFEVGADYGDEIVYQSGYDAGVLDGYAACGVVPSITETESITVALR